jgi:RimJ/RimL family protein N-acetyltransferase
MIGIVDIPALETERLLLRGHTLADFPAYAAMWTDPAFVQFSGGTPLSEEDAWARFLKPPGHWHLLGFGFWAIEEKATRRFVGDVGFADQHRGIEPSLKDIPEIGWALAMQAQAKGYATEAALAAIEWGETHFGRGRTACTIHPDNLASINVAEKCGYREAARTVHKGSPTIVFFREPGAGVTQIV